mmetsp:Transcript_86311/g.129367  ORF Transcript_86311/g.129367 Transcript_86311/m.129367 type:complete len:126 (-) Transcript_86311:1703-2080(-)
MLESLFDREASQWIFLQQTGHEVCCTRRYSVNGSNGPEQPTYDSRVEQLSAVSSLEPIQYTNGGIWHPSVEVFVPSEPKAICVVTKRRRRWKGQTSYEFVHQYAERPTLAYKIAASRIPRPDAMI